MSKTSTQRIAGRRRRIVVTKKEIMYIPILETLKCQLNNAKILQEVRVLANNFILCINYAVAYRLIVVIVILSFFAVT